MRKLLTGGSLILVATLLGLATAATAFAWVKSLPADTAAPAVSSEATRRAVVAVLDIPAGTRLTAAMVEVRHITDAAFVAGTPTDVEAVLGRVNRYPLLTGEQVNLRKLVMDGEVTGTGLAFAVPEGMRAFAVTLNEVRGAGGNIVPGDRVDVLVHTDYERLFGPTELTTTVASSEKRHPTVITVLQDVLVLAIAQQTTAPIDGQSDVAALRPDDAQVQPTATTATLALSPEQVQALFFASQEGTVALALRSFGDGGTTSLNPHLHIEPLGVVDITQFARN
jgi:pilus assembly protein CpaB